MWKEGTVDIVDPKISITKKVFSHRKLSSDGCWRATSIANCSTKLSTQDTERIVLLGLRSMQCGLVIQRGLKITSESIFDVTFRG